MVELQGRGGGWDWRCFCGLISAFLANSPSIIMARVLSDLSGIFCMFGFYLIMFYSGSLLCTFCSACLCFCTKKKKKTLYRLSKRHFYPLWFPFDSFSLPTLWNYKVPPWSDGANVALAEKLVQRADIHIYKHVILFAFMKFYFARLREKSILTNMWISCQCPHQPPKGYKRNCIFPSEVFFLTSGSE